MFVLRGAYLNGVLAQPRIRVTHNARRTMSQISPFTTSFKRLEVDFDAPLQSTQRGLKACKDWRNAELGHLCCLSGTVFWMLRPLGVVGIGGSLHVSRPRRVTNYQ